MKTNKRYITHAFFILFVMGVIAIVMNVFIPREHGMAYNEQMLLETGLDFEQMPYSVGHQYCDESCIDAQVYYELKVKGSDASKVINRLHRFPQYEGEITSNSLPPAWWKPGPAAIKIVYLNNANGTKIIIAHVEPPDNGSFVMYIQVIPF